MAPRILVVLTSQSTIPKSGKETGWYLVRKLPATKQTKPPQLTARSGKHSPSLPTPGKSSIKPVPLSPLHPLPAAKHLSTRAASASPSPRMTLAPLSFTATRAISGRRRSGWAI